MEFKRYLLEFLEPNLSVKVRKSKAKKAGVQGSVIEIDQYKFKTKMDNKVAVHFTYDEQDDS